ncbi:MAG: hypothetical protein E7214_08275 [Clostridium sp.]|nr:hypothetical protein [Clostridium sp.]
MFRFFIYKFFNTLSKPYETLNEDIFKKYISDENLINEILIIKQFKYLWRKKIGNTISKEKFKIQNIKTNKISNKYYLKVSVIHSFKLNNSNITSKELLKFNFLIKNKKISFMKNKEYVLLDSSENFSSLFNRNQVSKLELYSEKINNIDKLYIEYLKLLPNFKRSYTPEISQNHNRSSAISYARKYALNYNSKYKDFTDNGGDCTNFISQCLAAGNVPLSKTWRPYSNTWIRVNELYYYLSRKSIGTPASLDNTIHEGDILQFFSNPKSFFDHSSIITKVLDNDLLYCCHTYDKLDFPLSEVYPIIYNKLRFLNINY